ncbi:MAG TPA: hypothetical protein DCM14_06650 [Clostridiales bacterium UBA8153]|nr:hypothetical protein [Clostridiales bacterium UBA8153]
MTTRLAGWQSNCSSGHAIIMAYINIRDSLWVPLAPGRLTIVIRFILGILPFSRFSKGYSFLARRGVAVNGGHRH